MDFLDPKRKKSHSRRLLVGYLLVAVAISMATWLLLNSSLGYWVDPKTGSVIQNGTVFLDSQPGNSTITLNGKVQGNQTAARLVLPGSKQYTVKLSQDGYRDWNRTFSLEGGSIERLVYPLMLPQTLITTEAQLYATAPLMSSQSHDRRWLLVLQPGQSSVFDLYDLNSPSSAPETLTIPNNVMTEPTKTTSFVVTDWANDNRHVLMERSFTGGREYIMLDIESVANTLNINTSLTVVPTSVSLRDKKADQLYIYDAAAGTIRQGDLKNRTVSGALLNNVLAYESFGSDLILYATRQGAASGKLSYRVRENDKASYLLKSVPDTSAYLLDIAEFDSTSYFVVGSQSEDVVFVYRDPLPALKGQSKVPLLVSAVLRLTDPRFVSFSANGQFVSAQSGNKLVVYDIQGDRQYGLNLNHTIDKNIEIEWMDGFRFVYTDKEQSYITDFDGSNDQPVVPSISSAVPYFSPNSKTVFAIAPSLKAVGRSALTQTSLEKK